MSSIVSITGIIAITILEGIALFKSVDGSLLVPIISIIAGLTGYEIKRLKGDYDANNIK